MTAFNATRSADRRRYANGFSYAAIACLGLIPVAMAFAHRSSPFVITLAGAAALAAAIVGGRAGALWKDAAQRFRTPLGAATLGFLGWAALSMAWSPIKGTSLHTFGEFILPVAAALVLTTMRPSPMPPRQAIWFLAGSVGLASLVLMLELHGIGFRRVFDVRSHAFLFNRPTLTLLVLLVPLIDLLLRLRPKRAALGGALAALVLVTGVALQSHSGAAKLGLIAGAATYAMGRLSPRLAAGAIALCVVLAFSLAPVWGEIADRLLPAALHDQLAAAHSRVRVDIWQSFGAAIREQPILGAGFGTSPRFAETAVAALVQPEYRLLLEIGHPHNVPIQVWAELGVVGAVLATLVLLLILRALAGLSGERRALGLALFAAVFAVSLVGHGAWQGWWPASIGAAIAWFRFGDQWFKTGRSSKDGPHERV